MNTTGKKKTSNYFIVILLSLFCLSIQAQKKPTVYKIDQLVKRFDNSSDTIYVINFWATWCKPCVAELPDFEKINQEYKGKNVKVLLVSLDFKEDLKKKVIPFIKTNKYTCEVALLDEIDGNTFINKIDPKWTGAIPVTLVKKGTQRNFIPSKTTYEKLKEAIDGMK